jgi:CheY-like chemotaxis protein
MPMSGPFYRILVAEDNKVNLKLMKRILGTMNHEVESANDGIEILERLRDQRFDFILMDVQMPRMDGLETTRRILAGEDSAARPVIIAMTANAMKGDREKCLEAGMDDYLSKPIIITDLENMLEHWGSRREGQAVPKSTPPSPESQEIAAPDAVIDVQRLNEIRSHQSDLSLVLEWIEMYVTQCGERLKELQGYHAADNLEGMKDSAHSLKGACLNYGALQLAELCRTLENRLAARDSADLTDILDRMRDSMELTSRQMKNWVYDSSSLS